MPKVPANAKAQAVLERRRNGTKNGNNGAHLDNHRVLNPEGNGLSTKRQRFVDEYCITFNATRAAVAAGYAKKSAGASGSALLKVPEIMEAIEKKLVEYGRRNEIRKARVVRELECIAFGDRSLLVNERGALVPFEDMSEELRSCISGVDAATRIKDGNCEETVYKVRTYDKLPALQMLMRIFGMDVERKEIDVNHQVDIRHMVAVLEGKVQPTVVDDDFIEAEYQKAIEG